MVRLLLLTPLLGCLALSACGISEAIEAAIDEAAGDPGGGATPGSGADAQAVAVFDRVNRERATAGVPPLQWHVGAAAVALAHSQDMDARDFFAHTNPDGDDPGDRLARAGLFPSWWGENIAWGQPDSDAVMDDWMNSTGHRQNILNPNFTHLGVGVHDAAGGPWWTQVFLTP
jgi:uncharacterized protein YkwD